MMLPNGVYFLIACFVKIYKLLLIALWIAQGKHRQYYIASSYIFLSLDSFWRALYSYRSGADKSRKPCKRRSNHAEKKQP